MRRNQGSRPPRDRSRGRHSNGSNSPRGIRRGGPQGRANAQKMAEKYKGLARDAQLAGDRVKAESHFQHADHYMRLAQESGDQIKKTVEQKTTPEPNSNSTNGRDRTTSPKGSASPEGRDQIKSEKDQGNQMASLAEDVVSKMENGNDSPDAEAATSEESDKGQKTVVPGKTTPDDKTAKTSKDVSSDAG